MNKVTLIGRLVRDAELKATEKTSVAEFTLAIDRIKRKGQDNPGADFINCVAFGKTAEAIANYTRKGTKIAVDGSIQTGSYVNKDGKTVYTFKVGVGAFEFCESKTSAAQDAPADTGFMNVSDGSDELPF